MTAFSGPPPQGPFFLDLTELQALVDRQAEDPGLWFEAQRASEAYLQRALRELHAAIERITGAE